MNKAEKMRARLANMAKEREEFEAQRQFLENEMKASAKGKISSTALAVDAQQTAESGQAPSTTPKQLLRKDARKLSGAGLSSADSPSSSTASMPFASSQILAGAAKAIIPTGTRVSDWCYASTISMTGDPPPVVKVNEVYETVRNLGRGAFGDVLLVKNVEDNKLFADKTIFCETESVLGDVLRELFFLRKYRHPFIVDILDGFTIAQPRVLHIIMSYCEAGDLGKLIALNRRNKTFFSEIQLTKWILQIALAMVFLHESGVLHRDLKPCNVMLTEGGETVKVCDFGLALLAGSDGGIESASEAGTPYYTAPEMIQGKKYSYPADCWSYGIMVHELLALSRPFEGGTTSDLVRAILLEPPPPCPSHYSDNLRATVLGFLVKDPESRMGFAGLLIDSPLAQRVQLVPQAYRPKALEERIKRAHVKQLIGQLEMLQYARNSSLKGSPQPLLAIAEAAAAVPAMALAIIPGASSEVTLPQIALPAKSSAKVSPKSSPAGSPHVPSASRKKLSSVDEDSVGNAAPSAASGIIESKNLVMSKSLSAVALEEERARVAEPPPNPRSSSSKGGRATSTHTVASEEGALDGESKSSPCLEDTAGNIDSAPPDNPAEKLASQNDGVAAASSVCLSPAADLRGSGSDAQTHAQTLMALPELESGSVVGGRIGKQLAAAIAADLDLQEEGVA